MVQIGILYVDIKPFQALKLKLLDKNKFLMLETLRAKKTFLLLQEDKSFALVMSFQAWNIDFLC